jgi:hypothetical protein
MDNQTGANYKVLDPHPLAVILRNRREEVYDYWYMEGAIGKEDDPDFIYFAKFSLALTEYERYDGVSVLEDKILIIGYNYYGEGDW